MNLLQNADRALSGYANAKTDESISALILKILAEVECAAISDGADDDDAEAMARNAAILSAANAFQSAGFIDVYDALLRNLQ